MKQVYITFDEYYQVEQYNSFLNSAKNNNINFTEYISVRPPFNRYLQIDPNNLPVFVDYDLGTKKDEKFLVSTVIPVQANEISILKRREGADRTYWKYILPKEFYNIDKQNYAIVFKGFDITEIKEISKKFYEKTKSSAKIYQYGEVPVSKFKVYVCFNPYIANFIPSGRVILEFGKDKGTVKMPSNKGDFEYLINTRLNKEKIINKTYILPYYKEGKYYPLSKLIK